MNWRQLVSKDKYWQPLGKYNAMLPFVISIDPKDVPTLPAGVTVNGIYAGFEAPVLAFNGGFEGTVLTFEDSTDGTAAAQWTILMRDIVGRDQMNAPCHVRTIFGTAQLPAIIQEPLTLFYREKMTNFLKKVSGVAGTVSARINCGGVAYCPNSVEQQAYIADRIKKWERRRQNVFPFWYTIPMDSAGVVLTALQTLNFDIKVGNHFEAFKMAFVSTGDFAFEMSETRSGRVLSNGRISSAAGLGDATFPWIFDKPYLIPQGGRLRITLQDLSNAGNTIFLTIQGRKIVDVPLKDVSEVLHDTDVAFDDQTVRGDIYAGMRDELVSR